MNPQPLVRAIRRKLTARVILMASFSVLCCLWVASGLAQSAKEEREVEDKIPAHLPIKVKLRNAEKVKDLKNDDWMRDVEIEVKNTGDKPIYFLKISLFFIDVKKDSGAQLGYPLEYGRHELLDIENRAKPEDVPIQPGDTVTLKMHEAFVKGWAYYRTKVEKKPHPKKVGLRFHLINFGDGTGFATSGGVPVPNQTSCVGGQGGQSAAAVSGARSSGPPDSPRSLLGLLMPASFSPVNFFPGGEAKPSSVTREPQTCCSGMGWSCVRMRERPFGNCFCAGQGSNTVETDQTCTNPAASCSVQRTEDSECGEGETYHTCTNFFLDPCGTPPPQPTPTPSACGPYQSAPDGCYCDSGQVRCRGPRAPGGCLLTA